MLDQFTVCVLLYGDYTDLAKRCLTPLVEGRLFTDHHLRIGCNAVSDSTRQFLDELNLDCVYYNNVDNRKKYPVMRDMLYGATPVVTPYMMWFDDDSYLSQPVATWLEQVAEAMQSADMIGSRYIMPWRPGQREYVKQQPWYTGRDPYKRNGMTFVTGGWWTVRTELLIRHNYPWPALNHCGGDSMWGELCLQQSYRIRQFNNGVHINANATGKESASPRRGYTEQPLGTTGT